MRKCQITTVDELRKCFARFALRIDFENRRLGQGKNIVNINRYKRENNTEILKMLIGA